MNGGSYNISVVGMIAKGDTAMEIDPCSDGKTEGDASRSGKTATGLKGNAMGNTALINVETPGEAEGLTYASVKSASKVIVATKGDTPV